ncbi:MAG: DUF2207 domain-containing protein [Acidimicrobiia bacterium]|jgi:uncharacterized membrane protein YgcG|nr:DUF2207 domain-containing protein [Acidimicrobiia bacterium]
MLGRLPIWRHLVVLAIVVAGAALALFGIIGRTPVDEHLDANQFVVRPEGEGGVRIREVIDQDFGTNDRRGLERIIPNDAGVPADVVASSPDAPDDVSVEQVSDGTRIRIGDADVTIDGKHRYVLEYTLPEARLETGRLSLDAVAVEQALQTDRFEVIVTGLELSSPDCSVGAAGADGGCALERQGETYRAVIEPLRPGQGLTVSGGIERTFAPEELPLPELPERRSDRRALVAGLMIPTGLASAAAVYLISRRLGRNEVYPGGPADAAFSSTPGSWGPPGPGGPTTLVADDRLGDLATTEFVPPRGIEPWEAAVLVRERVDDATVSAWFSGLVGREAIVLERVDDSVVMHRGPRWDHVDAATGQILGDAFGGRDAITLGEYDEDFASAWRSVLEEQHRRVRDSGWWSRLPSTVTGSGALRWVVIAVVFWVFIGAGSFLSAFLGVFRSPAGAIVFGLVVPALAAYAMYRSLLPARTAAGSSLALRAESFRRFLAASEGQHVEWAWKQGLVRQYSAWAVALGAAAAWERALGASNVPPAEYSASGPLLLYYLPSSFAGATTAPSSSGGGFGGSGFGGGGFGGGFSGGGGVGGGGGGGTSGSW